LYYLCESGSVNGGGPGVRGGVRKGRRVAADDGGGCVGGLSIVWFLFGRKRP
jgi:hypothetical protein